MPLKKRADGRYVKKITDPRTGKTKSFYGKSEREINRKIMAYTGQAEKGRTFAEIAEEWWSETEPRLALQSVSTYRPAMDRAVAHFGEFSIKEFDFAAPAADKMANLSVVHGKMHVLMRIYTTICEGLNDGDVTIFETICDKDVFSVLQQVREANKTNTIEHIMAMNGSDDIHAKDRLYAIESLGSMLITMCRCENYYPFYEA